MEVGNGNVTDEQLAAQYQPGTDLGDELRNDNTLLNAQNRPNIPAAQPQQEVAAPELEGSSWAERLATEANKIGVLPGIGGWAKSLVASAVSALPQRPQQQPSGGARVASRVSKGISGLLNNIGDVAAVGTVPAGGGALTGLARTLNAGNQRLSQEESNRILRAESQARTIALTRNIYRQDREDRLASYAQTAKRIDSMRQDHSVQDGISQAQLNKMLQENPAYFDTHTGGAVSEEPVFDANGKQMLDKNGNQVFSPVYALAEIKTKDGADGSHEITQGDRDYFKRNTGVDLPVGTKLNTDQYTYLYTKSHAVQDVTDAIQKTNDGKLTADNLKQIQTELQDPALNHYAMMIPGQPLAGLYQASKNADQHIAQINQQIKSAGSNPQVVGPLQQKRQQFVDEQQKINHLITFGFNNAAKEKYADWQLKVQKQQEEERHNKAEEARQMLEAKTKAEGGSVKPVYAYNTQTKQLEQTTKGDVTNNPGLYTNPVDVKEADIRKDTDLARQLGDAQLNLSRYRAAAQQMDSLSLADKRAVAALIGEDKFKLHFLGTEVPLDWMNNLLTEENWRMLPKGAQDAVIGYIGARGAVIAYQKAVSGSGRSNKEQLQLELQNIPNPTLPKDVRERQFARFQQNIDQTGAGMPKMVGIERPKEIRQRIEADEAQKQQDQAKQQGATHIYDPGSGQIVPTDAKPIKNLFGRLLGYETRDGQKVFFKKPGE